MKQQRQMLMMGKENRELSMVQYGTEALNR